LDDDLNGSADGLDFSDAKKSVELNGLSWRRRPDPALYSEGGGISVFRYRLRGTKTAFVREQKCLRTSSEALISAPESKHVSVIVYLLCGVFLRTLSIIPHTGFLKVLEQLPVFGNMPPVRLRCPPWTGARDNRGSPLTQADRRP
jgi:hypothetical protein